MEDPLSVIVMYKLVAKVGWGGAAEGRQYR